MRTHTPPTTDEPTDDRVYPAERAFSTPRDRPAWRETEPSPSAGWRAVYYALDVPGGGA